MPKVTKPPVVAQRDYPFKRGNTYFIKFPEENGGYTEYEFPSVTTILGAVANKQALVNWAAKEAAKVALSNPHLSVEEVIANSITMRKSVAVDIGKAIHSFAEKYSQGEDLKLTDLSPELQPYGQAFLSFIDLFKPRVLFTEVCVFNKTYKYAGTVDLIAVLANGKTAILDWKTGKGTYKESHLQQMAYANAEYIYTRNKQTGKPEIIPMPKIHEQYLVHLKPNGTANLIPVQEPFEKFLKALEYYPVAEWLSSW